MVYVSTILFLLVFSIALKTHAQFTPQTYPDPRIDPTGCRLIFPGQVCDPSEILSAEQRVQLNDKIQRLQQITSNIRNTSPPCIGSQNSNLFIMVALMERLGTLPFESADVQKFTNLLRSKYQNYPDVGLCDTVVLIVNSRADRQVFTVAGRDAKLTREVLQNAFHRNLVHFRSGNYAMGLEGMVEQIVSAYSSAQIVQVPQIHSPSESIVQIPSSPISSSVGQFAAARGVPQKSEIQNGPDLESVEEKDKLWFTIMSRAVARCGNDPTKIASYMRALVEEAMDLSLKLISDSRYNQIEEESQDANGSRDRAWENAQHSFIDEMWNKYSSKLVEKADTCPETNKTSLV